LAGALTEQQIRTYQEDGVLLLKGAVSSEALARIVGLFKKIVDDFAAELYANGCLAELHTELPFETRWAAIRKEVPAVRPIVWRRALIDPAVYRLWFEPGLLNAAKSLLGPEIRAYHLFNGRPRQPDDPGQTIAWHQDAFNCPAWDQSDGRILTFWVPLVPVDETSGCLEVIPGSHKRGVLPKFTDDFGITKLRDALPEGQSGLAVALEPGDALMFDELVLHRSLDNVSQRVRWSIDIRFSAGSAAHQQKSPGGFRVASDISPPETFSQWAAKWNPKTGVMRRDLRRLDLALKILSEEEKRDARAY
jgi:phytanoyl-CoA hydroxylase